ncbi:MAG TPA: molybdopterin molybdenumtransferase MoeA [Thiothrix sp.]|nr:molybdopterin molybdenumtransferase MoeA [Thiothrix sp.]
MPKDTIKHDPSCADDYDAQSKSVEQARASIKQLISPIRDTEKLALRDSLNRVLAQPVISPIEVPSHTNSAMDGYAMAGSDLPDAEKATTKNYQVIGKAFAGNPYEGSCESGQVIRIMTGAVMPEGCDTVIMQEHVERVEGVEGVDTDKGITQIKIGSNHKAGQNVRQAGEDIALGSDVLNVGRRLTPADLGVIASLGISEVAVIRRPRIAFFSTGDELKSVGETLGKGDIYDSNRYTLFGMLKRLNVDIIDMGVIVDDPQILKQTFLSAASMADVIITSGGVSVGEADYIKDILDEIGDCDFWKIAMKPGRPLTFGSIENTLFFGLPGNPVSVMATFYQFVQPALHYLASGTVKYPLTIQANCLTSLRKRAGRFEFQRGIYQQEENGEISVQKTGQQGSGILTSMSQANCFILLPVEMTQLEAGEKVLIQPFDSFI